MIDFVVALVELSRQNAPWRLTSLSSLDKIISQNRRDAPKYLHWLRAEINPKATGKQGSRILPTQQH
jgi:hypothetical protein